MKLKEEEKSEVQREDNILSRRHNGEMKKRWANILTVVLPLKSVENCQYERERESKWLNLMVNVRKLNKPSWWNRLECSVKPTKKLLLELQGETADGARVLTMHYTSSLINWGTCLKHWNKEIDEEFWTLEMLFLRMCMNAWMDGLY